jgi:hypothetical protein
VAGMLFDEGNRNIPITEIWRWNIMDVMRYEGIAKSFQTELIMNKQQQTLIEKQHKGL